MHLLVHTNVLPSHVELPRVISYSQTTDFVHASTLATDSDYARFRSIGVDLDISLHETIIIKHAFFLV